VYKYLKNAHIQFIQIKISKCLKNSRLLILGSGLLDASGAIPLKKIKKATFRCAPPTQMKRVDHNTCHCDTTSSLESFNSNSKLKFNAFETPVHL